MKRIAGLPVAAATLSGLVTASLVIAAPAQATPAGDRATSVGASWLESQLTDGILHNEEYDYDDLGLSADVAFALDAVGGRDTSVTAIVDAIEPVSDNWVTGGQGRIYAGSLAKMVSVVQAAGEDPTAYSGADQVARLDDLVNTSAPLTGRLEDAGVDPASSWDADFVNVIGQSFAVRALTTAGAPHADEATAFLLDQQCNAGFFRSTLESDKSASGQGCDDATDSGSIDTTALTVINILDTEGASTAAKGAAALAATWLQSQQSADGSFTGGDVGANANSTGLAGWALAKAGHPSAATKAATWLRDLQVADLAPCATALSGDNGAIVYSADDRTTVRSAGTLDVPVRERARRASAQALPAIASVPAGDVVTIAAPATATEGDTVTVTVRGLGAGEPGCVSLGGTAKPVTGTGAPVDVSIVLPAGAATRTFAVTTLGGQATASTAVSMRPTSTPTPTPTPDPVTGELVASKVEKVRRNHTLRLAVRCEGPEVCAGKIKVRTARPVERRDGSHRRMVLAKATYDVAAGERAVVTLRLTKPARAIVGRTRLKVAATQVTRDGDRAKTPFWLRRT